MSDRRPSSARRSSSCWLSSASASRCRGRLRRVDGWLVATGVAVYGVFAAPRADGPRHVPRLHQARRHRHVPGDARPGDHHGYDAAGLAPSTYETLLDAAYVNGYPLGSLLPLGTGTHSSGGRRLALAALHHVPGRPGRARALPARLGAGRVARASRRRRLRRRPGGARSTATPSGEASRSSSRRRSSLTIAALVPLTARQARCQGGASARRGLRRARRRPERRRRRLAGAAARRRRLPACPSDAASAVRRRLSLAFVARDGAVRDPAARDNRQVAVSVRDLHRGHRRRVREPHPAAELAPGLRHLAPRRLPDAAEEPGRDLRPRRARGAGAMLAVVVAWPRRAWSLPVASRRRRARLPRLRGSGSPWIAGKALAIGLPRSSSPPA